MLRGAAGKLLRDALTRKAWVAWATVGPSLALRDELGVRLFLVAQAAGA